MADQNHQSRRSQRGVNQPSEIRGKLILKQNTSGKKVRRVLRLIGWNAVFIVVGLTLIVAVGEIYFRWKMPFTHLQIPSRFDPEMGLVRDANALLYHTNNLDFWIVSRTNSLGFLDREPRTAMASMGCHIVMIGDSMVEAQEVAISDRFQVQLEELAAQTLPHLMVTTSAFGRSDTGQINQLPYYDKHARFMNPKLLVIVFNLNDFWDNSPFLSAIIKGFHPEHMPFVTAERNEDGTMRLRPPDPEYFKVPGPSDSPSLLQRVAEVSRFAKWVEAKTNLYFWLSVRSPWMLEWRKTLKEYPAYETLPPEWWPSSRGEAYDTFQEDSLPLFYEESMDFTEFALDEFKKRADRDDVALVILSTHHVGTEGDPAFDRMKAMAQARGIPVISQFDYIIHSGGRIEDASFRHDIHWTTTGHRWASEALLQYLAQNQSICDNPGER